MVTSGRDGGGGAGGRLKVNEVTGLVLIGSLFALPLGHRPEITHEAIPAGGKAPAETA